jgi:RimJ/RimL family protein N-acetyltransferase
MQPTQNDIQFLGQALGPTLKTDRLILRPLDIDADFEAICETYADAPTMRYLTGAVMDRAQTWRSIAMMLGHYMVRGYSFLSVIEKSSGQWVGRVGPWFPEGWPVPEVGWTIHPAHTRQGFAKEAGRACLDYVRDDLGWTSVNHVIAEGNIGSERTAEALGSTRLYRLEHGIPGALTEPCHVYGQDF